jgi:5-methylcytosine-specific restriction enzyme A
MKSFLITYKPSNENPDLGWPVEELQKLLRRKNDVEKPKEMWRFRNRSEVAEGDHVFLLLQGKGGPAIVGYGEVAAKPENTSGRWRALVEFKAIVDPATHFFADRDDLLAIEGARNLWRTQASGVRIPEQVARELERLVSWGQQPKPRSAQKDVNPDWTRDELILALKVYLQHRPNPPGKESAEILQLSRMLNQLGEKLFPPELRAETFRNANGVYMKLMNFRRLDPQYTGDGKTRLQRGAKGEEEAVWADFAEDSVRCRRVADAIIASLDDSEIGAPSLDSDTPEGFEEASEGRLLTRLHLVRERNRKLVEKKREQVLKSYGRLTCEACDFDFAVCYGDRGHGFIECHHTKPIATLADGHKTHINDLALVCSNCHRIIHRRRPWLSISELKALTQKAQN